MSENAAAELTADDSSLARSCLERLPQGPHREHLLRICDGKATPEDKLFMLAKSPQGPFLVRPVWPLVHQMPAVELEVAVGLSCGLDQMAASQRFAIFLMEMGHEVLENYGLVELGERTREFLSRLLVAQANRKPFGKLQLYDQSGRMIPEAASYGPGSMVELKGFVTWAAGMGWDGPAEFTGLVERAPKELGEKERNKMLATIAHLACFAKVSSAEELSRVLAKRAEELGSKIGGANADTLRKYLKAAAENEEDFRHEDYFKPSVKIAP